MRHPSQNRTPVRVGGAPAQQARCGSPFAGLRGGAVSLVLALVAVLGLTLRPTCDVLAAAAPNTGGAGFAAIAAVGDPAGARAADSHGDDEGPCCASVEDGSLVAPDNSSAIAGAGAQPVVASFLPWRIPNPDVGRLLPAAGPSAFLPPAFHARSAPLRR